MSESPIPLHLDGLVVHGVHESPHELLLEVASWSASRPCPRCETSSSRVHSRYLRWPDDLPCFDRPVRLQLTVRRFFCDEEGCPQRIFAERFPEITAPHARRTTRLSGALRRIAFSVGALPGARLARRLWMPTSASTLLRLLRRFIRPPGSTPRVLGVDDWALRRGQVYGTILVDLERHQVVDLLEGREAAALADWLRQRPGVEIISRDRSPTYAKGARDGAPEAVQVADRWHVLKNLAEAVEALLKKHIPLLQRVHQAFQERLRPPEAAKAAPPAEPALSISQQNRLARYEQVRALHQRGYSQAAISRQMGLDRRTVRTYTQGPFPMDRRPTRQRTLDRHRAYLHRRWHQEGCQDSQTVWQELRERGYQGSIRSVQRYVAPWREASSRASRGRSVPAVPPAVSRFRKLSPRQVTWWLLAREAPLTAEEQWMRQRLLEEPAIAEVGGLGRAFQRMVRDKDDAALAGWMKQAGAVGSLKSFVNGLKRDLDAVREAIRSEWSQGQTEGQVNRIKTLKRQMYGRASFALLRGRVLEASAEQQEIAAAKKDRRQRRAAARRAA